MPEISTQEKTELQIPTTLKSLIEALIFAAAEPLSIKQIKAIFEVDGRDESRRLEADALREIITELNEEYEKTDKPYRIIQIGGGYQFATLLQYAEWLGKLYKEQARRKLSQSGIETLAIIAYKQPVTKPEIESIRGVNCDYVLKTLLEKELTTVVGRAETVGRPLLYGTTRDFLRHFGLNEITDLPRPREIEEILGESQFETERRMLEAQVGAEQVKKEEEDFKSRLPHIPKRKPELNKEVEIVPKKKSRDLRTIAEQERRVLEEAGQEKIEFVRPQKEHPIELDETASASTQLPSVPPPSVVEPPTDRIDEPRVPPEPRTESEPESPVEGSGSSVGEDQQAEEKVQSTFAVEIREQEQDKQTEPNRKVSPPTADVPAQPVVSSFVPQVSEPLHAESQPKSKWQNWKEQIRGFIKKLFA